MPDRPNQPDPPTLDENRAWPAEILGTGGRITAITAVSRLAGTPQQRFTALAAILAVALFASGQARAQPYSSMTFNTLSAQGNATVGGTLGVTGNTRLGAYTQIGTSGNYVAINPNPSPAGNTYVNVGGTGPLWVTPPIGGWWFTPKYTYSAISSTNPLFYFNGTASGSAPTKSELFTKIGCNDGVDFISNTGATGAGDCLWVIDNLGTGWSGGRIAVNAMVNVLATPSVPTPNFISAVAANAGASFNVGGTDRQSAGYLAAFQYQTVLNAGATHYAMAEGWEGGVQVNPGASAAYVNGGKITVSGCGTASCNGLAIVGGGSLSPAKVGISFGSVEAPVFGVASNGTLIGTEEFGGSGGSTRSAALGVDFSGVTFSTGAFKSNGFFVDGTGHVSAAGLTLVPAAPSRSSAPCTPGQIAVDSSYVYVCTGPNAWKRAALGSW